MDEELKKLMEKTAAEIKALKDSSAEKTVVNDLTAKFAEIQEAMKTVPNAAEMKKHEDSLHAMSTKLEGMKMPEVKLGFKENIDAQISAKLEDLDRFEKGETKSMVMNLKGLSLKTHTSASLSDDTDSLASGEFGKINRGMEFMRRMFRIRPVGPDSHDSVSYWEQEAITDNASGIAEGGKSGTQSSMTWVKKSLSSKRVHDWTKVGRDVLKDVTWVREQIIEMINKNIRLNENTQLITGTGLGNNMQGIRPLATAFDSTIGKKYENATIYDLITKCKTQIRKQTLGANTPTFVHLSPERVEELRLMRDTMGRPINEAWMFGDVMNVAGMQIVENELIDYDEMLVADFSVGTLYVWDEAQVEFGRIDDDLLTGDMTMTVYLRENLLIKSTDYKAIVKVDDIDTAIEAISVVEN